MKRLLKVSFKLISQVNKSSNHKKKFLEYKAKGENQLQTYELLKTNWESSHSLCLQKLVASVMYKPHHLYHYSPFRCVEHRNEWINKSQVYMSTHLPVKRLCYPSTMKVCAGVFNFFMRLLLSTRSAVCWSMPAVDNQDIRFPSI